MVSKYTMEVRYICEQLANATIETQVGDVPGIIEKAAPQIFDFDFPIWNEDYRKTLEEKILLHFYMREIGQETVGEWKLRLMQTLQEVMPEMNELYKSVEFKYDPLTDIDYTTDTKGGTEVNSTRNTSVKEGMKIRRIAERIRKHITEITNRVSATLRRVSWKMFGTGRISRQQIETLETTLQRILTRQNEILQEVQALTAREQEVKLETTKPKEHLCQECTEKVASEAMGD